MASKEEILGILAGETGPMNRTVLGKRLDLPTSSFQNQLDRMEKQGLVEKNEQHEYIITEAGRQFALAAPPGGGTPPGEETEESLKTTEYQQFIEMGKITGVVPVALLEQTANHIWRGGDFRDLVWVWKGLTEMGIRHDLAQRWWHSWRSYLHQAVPPELATSVGAPQAPVEKGAKEVTEIGRGKRDYILGLNDTPIKVGEGLGDLDYEDAVRLSTVRAAAQARGGVQAAPGGQPATVGAMADEMTKVFNAVKEFLGPQSKGRSYIVKPGEGGYTVEEVEEGKPTVVTAPGQGGGTPSPSFLVDAEGNVTEAPAGRPIVIKQIAQSSSPPGKTYLVRQTPEGMVTEEYDAGKPIIINTPSSPGSNMPGMMPFPVFGEDGKPVYDSEGKPVYANIEPMMKWMGFQSEQRRAEERHSTLMGLAQAVKENLGDGIAALKAAAEEAKRGVGAKPPAAKPQLYECADCHTQFSIPDVPFETVKCPNPACGRVYNKEEVMSA